MSDKCPHGGAPQGCQGCSPRGQETWRLIKEWGEANNCQRCGKPERPTPAVPQPDPMCSPCPGCGGPREHYQTHSEYGCIQFLRARIERLEELVKRAQV